MIDADLLVRACASLLVCTYSVQLGPMSEPCVAQLVLVRQDRLAAAGAGAGMHQHQAEDGAAWSAGAEHESWASAFAADCGCEDPTAFGDLPRGPVYCSAPILVVPEGCVPELTELFGKMIRRCIMPESPVAPPLAASTKPGSSSGNVQASSPSRGGSNGLESLPGPLTDSPAPSSCRMRLCGWLCGPEDEAAASDPAVTGAKESSLPGCVQQRQREQQRQHQVEQQEEEQQHGCTAACGASPELCGTQVLDSAAASWAWCEHFRPLASDIGEVLLSGVSRSDRLPPPSPAAAARVPPSLSAAAAAAPRCQRRTLGSAEHTRRKSLRGGAAAAGGTETTAALHPVVEYMAVNHLWGCLALVLAGLYTCRAVWGVGVRV
jgi:hypothetical protein